MPVAGLGTRFLPATKAQAKEMFTVVDRPLIQYAVEEAAASGSNEIVLVSAPGKGAILEHFSVDAALERTLAERGKSALLEVVEHAGRLAEVSAVMQGEPLGVGHAILQAREAVGDEVFGVAFPDDFILAETPVLEQLRRVHAERGGIVVAVEPVPEDRVDQYGVIEGAEVADGVYEVSRLVEKPPVDEAPSNLSIVGRYVFPASIFEWIERTGTGAGGEYQITDAMQAALRAMPCHAVVFEGTRYDCGSRLGFLQASVAVARRDPEMAGPLAEWLSTLD
ncbi:MAG: UTP--glucose-1-phosphate uridylyltransferase [Acidobacteria bacterium]|nr:UTP--glucose-1-phosphate uridylyltransferase [Acidobacteriota bacterium]